MEQVRMLMIQVVIALIKANMMQPIQSRPRMGHGTFVSFVGTLKKIVKE